MEIKAIMNKLQNKQRGSYFRIDWLSDVPITAQAKREGHTVLKYSHNTCRYGIRYKNLKSVQEKIANGKEVTGELPWGQFVPGYEGILIEHKGKHYIRLYTSPNKSQVTYFLNGRPIEPDELQKKGIVQNSYWNKGKEPLDCMTVKCENLQDIY